MSNENPRWKISSLEQSVPAYWDHTFHDTLEPWIRRQWDRLTFAFIPSELFFFERWSLKKTLAEGSKFNDRILLFQHVTNPKVREDLISLAFHSGYRFWILLPSLNDLEFPKEFYKITPMSFSDLVGEQSSIFLGDAQAVMSLPKVSAAFSGGDECTDGYLFEKEDQVLIQ